MSSASKASNNKTLNLSRNDLYTANRRAFEDIFGNPNSFPEPILGAYQTLKGRGLIAAMKTNFDEGKATRNAATPTLMDFFCDVDNIVTRNLTPDEVKKFLKTYIYEDTKGTFTDQERQSIEQKLGRLFRARKISPTSRYFRATRKALAR